MGCEMYGQSTWWSFGFWREPEKERQKQALAELSAEHKELLTALIDAAWYCYDWFSLWCPPWERAIEILAPEVISRIIEQGRSVGLSEQECSYWYNWIARGANKAMPSISTADGNSFCFSPIHAAGIGGPAAHLGIRRTFEHDYQSRVPPRDGEVISLLMVRAGLEWLEHLKSQGKL